jgi:hypothetical protein
MNPLLAPIAPLLLLFQITWGRLQLKREDDRGITTEVVIITALLAVLAIGVVGVIATAVTNKGNDVRDTINGVDATP